MNILELAERANGLDISELSWFPMQYDSDPPIFEVLTARYMGVRKLSPDVQG